MIDPLLLLGSSHLIVGIFNLATKGALHAKLLLAALLFFVSNRMTS